MRAVDFNSMVKGDTDMTQQEIQKLAQALAPMISNQINENACKAVSDMLQST